MNLFELVAKLSLDSSGFDSGVQKAEGAGNSLSSKMEGMFGKIEKAAKFFVSGVVINKAVGLVRNLATETASAGDRIDKQSQVLGMSRKAYQEWDYIMSQNGMTIDQMTTGMKTLNSTILSGVDGSEEAKDAFAQLGLSVHDLEGMSQEDQFETVIRAFQRMPAGAQKSALAVKIFGKAGMQMLPLLNNTTTSIDEMRQKAEDLGLIMSDDAVDASVAYTDSLDTMKRTFDGIKFAIGSKVLPILTKGMEKITQYAGKIRKAFTEGGWTGVWDMLKRDWSSFVSNLQQSDNGILKTIGDVLDGLGKGAQFVIDLITNFPGTIEKLKLSDNTILKIIGDLLGDIEIAIGVVSGLFTDFDQTIDNMKASDNFILKLIAELLATIKDGFGAVIDIINGDWASAIEKMKTSKSTILNTVGDVAESFVNAKNRAEEAIDATKEFLGVAGANGKLYGTYTAKKAKEFGELKTEEERQKWLGNLMSDMQSAGFTYEQANTARKHFERYKLGDTSGMVGAELGLLSNPVYYDKQAILDQWKQEDNVITVEVEAVTNEEKLQEELDMQQQIVDKDPITRRIMFKQFAQEHPFGATGNETYWVNPGEKPVSHAKGLWDVPYDGYLAELHRHERVMTASQARHEDNGGFDIGSLTASISSAVKSAIENATIRSYINGRDITDDVNRNAMMKLKARRFAT